MKTRVAKALVKASRTAGRSYASTKSESMKTRVENLLRVGPYGAYVVDGDPYDWGGGGAVATILMESKGGEDDCIVPLEYYEDGFDVSYEASQLLGDHYIEFVNAAVAVVYKS